jgi:hypothetical protein
VAQLTLDKDGSLERSVRITEAGIVYLLTVSALYIFFAADMANKVLNYLGLDFSRVSVLFRSLYELLFFSILLIFPSKQRMLFIIVLVTSFLLFLLGQVVFSMHVEFRVNFIENILFFNKYYFLFVIYFAIYKLQDHPTLFAKALRVMERLLLLNAWLALIGLVFGIGIFRTYILQSYRFGYSGILWAQNEATVMCVLGISYFYYKHFILGEKTRALLIVIVASLFLGTKGIYVFLVMLIIYHFMANSSLKAKILVFLLIAAIYFFLSWFLSTEISEELLAYFVKKADQNGIWYVLFSGRTLYLSLVNTHIVQYWTIVNYLFGGQDPVNYMIEMDFFDLFFFMGVVGFIIYFVLLFSTVFRFRKSNTFNLFFIFTYLTLAFLGGHFFSSVTNAVYLCLISMYFYVNSRKPKKLNEENTAHQ